MDRLPIWVPDTKPKVNTGMKADSPFILTSTLVRSDLGQCVISMEAPRYVAKVRSFRTCPRNDNGKSVDIANKQEDVRRQYFSQRETAEALGQLADSYNTSVRDLIGNPPERYAGQLPKVYDEEFDESRVIAKVTGLNVYLEFFGCLDDIDPEDIDWDGHDGVYATLRNMAEWYPSTLTFSDRQARATREDDLQLLDEWERDTYDPNATRLPQKRGIGVWPHIDTSRRPDLLHANVPKARGYDKDAIEAVKTIKAKRAESHRNH